MGRTVGRRADSQEQFSRTGNFLANLSRKTGAGQGKGGIDLQCRSRIFLLVNHQ